MARDAEVNSARSAAINKMRAAVDGKKYAAAQQKQVTAIMEEYREKISNSTDPAMINTMAENAVKRLGKIKSQN